MLHAVGNDFLCCSRDRHEARGALPVDAQARYARRQTGAQSRLPRDVEAARSLLHGRAHHDIVDFSRINACALDRMRKLLADHAAKKKED